MPNSSPINPGGPRQTSSHAQQSSHSSRQSSHSSKDSSHSSESPKHHSKPEDGDYIINWHLQYIANIMLQCQTNLRSLQDQIKTEILKMKADGDFIKQQLPGNHSHLNRLKNQDRDLRSAIDPIDNLNDLFKLIASRAAERMV